MLKEHFENDGFIYLYVLSSCLHSATLFIDDATVIALHLYSLIQVESLL